MTTWQQLVITFDSIFESGVRTGIMRQPGIVRYPEDLAGQEINAVLDQFGRQGNEVVHLGTNDGTGVIELKKSG